MLFPRVSGIILSAINGYEPITTRNTFNFLFKPKPMNLHLKVTVAGLAFFAIIIVTTSCNQNTQMPTQLVDTLGMARIRLLDDAPLYKLEFQREKAIHDWDSVSNTGTQKIEMASTKVEMVAAKWLEKPTDIDYITLDLLIMDILNSLHQYDQQAKPTDVDSVIVVQSADLDLQVSYGIKTETTAEVKIAPKDLGSATGNAGGTRAFDKTVTSSFHLVPPKGELGGDRSAVEVMLTQKKAALEEAIAEKTRLSEACGFDQVCTELITITQKVRILTQDVKNLTGALDKKFGEELLAGMTEVSDNFYRLSKQYGTNVNQSLSVKFDFKVSNDKTYGFKLSILDVVSFGRTTTTSNGRQNSVTVKFKKVIKPVPVIAMAP
jgi:hypothetical protein